MHRSRDTRRTSASDPYTRRSVVSLFSLIICLSINLLIYISTYLHFEVRAHRYDMEGDLPIFLSSFRNAPPLSSPPYQSSLVWPSLVFTLSLLIYLFIFFFFLFSPNASRGFSRTLVQLSSTVPCRSFPFPVAVARSVLLRARFIRRCTTGDKRVSTRQERDTNERDDLELYRELATFFLSRSLSLGHDFNRRTLSRTSAPHKLS